MVNASDCFLVTPQNNWGCSTRVESLRDSNGLTTSMILRFLSTLPDAFTHLSQKNVRNFIQNFAQKGSHRL